MPVLARGEDRRLSDRIDRIEPHSTLQQRRSGLAVPGVGRRVQRGAAVLIRSVLRRRCDVIKPAAAL